MGQNSTQHVSASSGAQRVQAAIAHGAARTGVAFDYLLAQARIESALDPSARASTSSATGLFQFIDSTWLATLRKHGPDHGLGQLAAAIQQGPNGAFVADPTQRQLILSLRHDPALASVMAGALAQDNRAALLPVLGREPDAAELYLAHFLGEGGASRFLKAMQSDPAQSAAALFPKQASANRGIFYQSGGPARSLGEVMELMRGKMARAMDGPVPPAAIAAAPAGAMPVTPWQAVQTRFAEQARSFSDAGQTPRPLSSVLAETFSAGGPAAGDHVRRAYGQLRSFGL